MSAFLASFKISFSSTTLIIIVTVSKLKQIIYRPGIIVEFATVVQFPVVVVVVVEVAAVYCLSRKLHNFAIRGSIKINYSIRTKIAPIDPLNIPLNSRIAKVAAGGDIFLYHRTGLSSPSSITMDLKYNLHLNTTQNSTNLSGSSLAICNSNLFN